MPRLAKLLLGATALLLVSLAYGQRPSELNERGEAYLRVNMNPTDVPPMVNINPFNQVPKVEVTRMPEMQIKPTAPSGCANRQNFRTGIANSISGPLMLTYLNIPQQVTATLADPNGSQSINLSSAGQITTGIFLQADQRLNFDSAVIYSGCQPN
jgi:hypothetical protein